MKQRLRLAITAAMFAAFTTMGMSVAPIAAADATPQGQQSMTGDQPSTVPMPPPKGNADAYDTQQNLHGADDQSTRVGPQGENDMAGPEADEPMEPKGNLDSQATNRPDQPEAGNSTTRVGPQGEKSMVGPKAGVPTTEPAQPKPKGNLNNNPGQ